MKRVFTAACLALMCAAGLAAQTQADDQKKPADAAKVDEKVEKAVTITGCLRAGDTPNAFVLANVKTDEPAPAPDPAPPTPPDPPSTPPTPPTPPDPPSTPPTPPTPPTNPPSTPPTPPTNPPSTPPAPPTNPPMPPTPPDPATPPTPPSAPEPVGTSGAGDVRLIGAPANLDLAKHVGHTVSITGTFVPAGKAAKSAGSGAADARSLNVKSMKHISETCK
jgi:outer membrane biosynthesis protein TonB